jgi:hypothetical protein
MSKGHLNTRHDTLTYPLTGGAADYDPLLALIGDARFVLLGATCAVLVTRRSAVTPWHTFSVFAYLHRRGSCAA